MFFKFYLFIFLNLHLCVLGQALRPALDPEPLCGAHVHLYAGRKALSEGPDPERLSVETGTWFTHANLFQFCVCEVCVCFLSLNCLFLYL